MALQKSYTDPSGTPHPSAYFVVWEVGFIKTGLAQIDVLGYHAATTTASATISQDTYTLTAAQTTQYFSPAAISSAGGLFAAAYQALLATQTFFSGAASV